MANSVVNLVENPVESSNSMSNCFNWLSKANILETKSKFMEFSDYFLGPGRLHLLQANHSECEEFIFLILNMKKHFKHMLTDLGKSHIKKDYSFRCVVCDDKIVISNSNFWEVVQNHEHIEEMYYKFLNGEFALKQESPNIKEEEFPVSLNISLSRDISYKDSDSDNVDKQSESSMYDSNELNLEEEEVIENNVNSFRFNFVPTYDEVIQKKLYPEKRVQSLKKYDKTEYSTIVSVGPFRAVCLLCPCDLVSRSNKRMGIQFFLDHITGNRHMKLLLEKDNIDGVINFHETWLNQEPVFQAHQVYFRPDGPHGLALKCVLCCQNVSRKKLPEHILTEDHKFQVLENFQRNDTSYYLMDWQVQAYGVIPKPEVNIKHTSVGSPAKVNEKNNRKVKAKLETKSEKAVDTKDQVEDESPHQIIKSVENPASKIVSEFIPNRLKNHSKFFVRYDNTITCKICQIRFPAEITWLVMHICDRVHMFKSKVPITAYKYYCEVCNLRIPDEFLWQKHFEAAVKFHAKLPESRKKKIVEYECTKCLTVIFGDELSLSRHLSTRRGGKKVTETKLAKSVAKIFKNQDSIKAEAAKLLSAANKTLENNNPTMECCQSVENLLSTVFEYCKVHPFGSRISGLGNENSDLDLFLDTGDMYTGYNNQDSISQVQLVKRVFIVMAKVKEEFQNVFQIPTARTPIVKFHHKKTKIDCDLSFRHGLSVENTKFLRFCFDMLPICQPFILILKMWSHENNLSEYITTYAIAIMAIFHLQTKGYLLSVKQLRYLNPGKSLTICGWETINYCQSVEMLKRHVIPYTGSIIELLKDFFLYYSKFAYPVDVICPLMGQCIKKKDFNDTGKNLPPEMNSYRVQLQSKEPEAFRNASLLCIQDPFDLSHNLTKALQVGTLNKLRILCELSYKLIKDL